MVPMTTTAATVNGNREHAYPTSIERLAELDAAGCFPVVRIDGLYCLADVKRSGNTQWRVEYTPVTAYEPIAPFSRTYPNTAKVIVVTWPDTKDAS